MGSTLPHRYRADERRLAVPPRAQRVLVSSPPVRRRTGSENAASPLLRAGRWAWALLGVLGVVVVAGLVMGRLTLVVVPLVIALFPAALLEPAARFLRGLRLPPALASLLTILGSLLVVAGVVTGLVPLVADEAPALAESLREGVDDLLRQLPFDVGGLEQVLDRARAELAERGGGIGGGAVQAATAVFEVLAGLLFGFVALFFYLKDGARIASGVRDLLPAALQPHATEMGRRVWTTLGAYFRGQLLIALVDAVLIGLGLVVLGIPLALPLAVLILFGGLFPIVGAVATGALAVFVALAHAGVGTALITLGIVVGVQQLEGNVLEPLVLGRVVALHPLLVVTVITAGAVTLGVLGAFLAVPVAASIARVVDYLRGRDDDSGEETDDEEPVPTSVTASSS